MKRRRKWEGEGCGPKCAPAPLRDLWSMTYAIPLSHLCLSLKCIVTGFSLAIPGPSPAIHNAHNPQSHVSYSRGYVLQSLSSDGTRRLNHRCSITTTGAGAKAFIHFSAHFIVAYTILFSLSRALVGKHFTLFY